MGVRMPTATSFVDEHDAEVPFRLCQYGFAGRKRFKDEIVDVEPGAVNAL
jgi:hypothetical protein